MQPASAVLLNTLPSSETIRARLAELARERMLLRDMLKLALKREQELQHKKVSTPA